MTTDPLPSHLTATWQQALSTPQHWCRSCQEYRVRHTGDLCPVCADDKRREEAA